MKGKVKRIHTGKTFCFVTGDDNKEYFLHRESFNGFWQDLLDDMEIGPIYVEFEPTSNPKGLRAENARRVDWPN